MDPTLTISPDAGGLNARAFADSGAVPCGCPLCLGIATVVETGEPFGQSYLNADERAAGAVGGKVSFSIDRAGLQMVGFNPVTMAPEPGWGGVAGQAYTVTYAFRSSAPITMPSETEGFQRFNATQIAWTEQALQGWADVANIRFVRIGSGTDGEAAYSNDASILLGNFTSGADGSAGFANFPGNPAASSASGDVWIAITRGTNGMPEMGNYGAHVLVHEIGHAIGLMHPGDYNAEEDTTITYAEHAEYYEDSRQYSVMSYFSEANTGAAYGPGRYAAAPQLDDIRAAQYEYGPNMSTRTGDTVYGFNSNAGRDWFVATSSSTRLVFAVWDAGGVDTFDFSRYGQNQLIDLREGHFSNVGSLVGNVAVAQGAKIENAIGGLGADTIHGNALNNLIEGGSGADRVFAGGGSDTILGGEGGGYLRGEDGADSILGGSGFDDIHGNTGNDTASGGAGHDWVVGGKDNDILFGNSGDDIVFGNLGDDTCVGGDGADTVRGGQGADSLMGDGGADFMSGDRGDDTIVGGGGADLFHFFADAGMDRVLDFSAAEGDRVNLAPGTAYSVSQVGADTVIAIAGTGDRMVLVNVQLGALPDGWIFGA
ncbi:MAG: M57 family metalloprotease [Phenylobacterium sp.]|nr:M57 family metalloprotease [Phenylobacterium sp.]